MMRVIILQEKEIRIIFNLFLIFLTKDSCSHILYDTVNNMAPYNIFYLLI